MVHYRQAAFFLSCLTAMSTYGAREVTLTLPDAGAERIISNEFSSKKQSKKQKRTQKIAQSANTINPTGILDQKSTELLAMPNEQNPAVQTTLVAGKKPYYNRNRVTHTNRKKFVAKKNKTLSEMNFDELKEAKNRAVKAKNTEIALKYMQKMLPLCNDLTEHATLMLETADALLATGAVKEASSMYQDFSTMYPGHARIKYASFKAIDCSYATVLIAERDQTATLTTIELAETFLTQNDSCKDYYKEVETILSACYKLRFDSEVSIINFFIKQKNIASAQKRIERIREKQLPVFPAGERELIELECLVASKKNDTELLLQKQTELATKFPEQNSVQLAHNRRNVDHVAKF